jgi:hypothetical protein
MKVCYLRDLQGDEWVYIQGEDDTRFYREFFGLDDGVTGFVLGAGSLEAGGFEPDDKIAFTEYAAPYNLDSLYTVATYGELMGEGV